MKHLRFAVCGAGNRGSGLTEAILLNLPEVTVCGIYDPDIDKAEKLAATVKEKAGYEPKVYHDLDAMFDAEQPDAALVSTSWESHVPVAINAMNRGIATAMEVGAVYNEQECWDLIEAYERTKTPFMLLENCCYGKDELFVTAMARAAKLGEIVYCHGAYMHDLREEVSYGEIKRHYRNGEYTKHCRDNYPTHELGPIAKILGINRGNRMVSLVSMASKARGLSAYIAERDDLESLKDRVFKQGDIVETLITCENGELISLRLDTTLPTHYSREVTIRGTKGSYSQSPNMVLLDGEEEEWEPAKVVKREVDNATKYYDEFLPDIWKNITQEELDAGHGGMDVFEFRDFCDCLRNGKEITFP